MNSTSPSSPTPFARPQRVDPNTENRGSGLRASILESALELGVGSNRTVANWIFNPVQEADEEDEVEDVNSPSLTYASTATSEESNLSAGLAQRSQPGAGILVNGKDQPLSLDTSVQSSRHPSSERVTPEPSQRALQFDLRATPEPRAPSPLPPAPSPQPKSKFSKLRRKKRGDGYESDGGYVSDGGKSKEKKEKKSKKAGKGKNGEPQGAATDYESDGAYLSEVGVKKKKTKKEKKDKDKSKNGSPTTDNETDKGYSSSFSKSRSRKQSATSPASGDESDGGYLSEASKKRRFFRLNSKSRKKQDSHSSSEQAPPVPALPVLPHPIADKWSRSGTPMSFDSGNSTPMPSDTASSVRPSGETFTSLDTFTMGDTSTSTAAESDEKRDSFPSSEEGLTRAFRDAESVRSPSIDFLSTFRRPAGHSPLSPSRADTATPPRSPLVPALTPSKSVRSRPKISAPNTTTLAPKHVPVPLTLTPPTPTSLSTRYSSSGDPDYVLITPSATAPNTPHAPEQGHSSNLSVTSTGSNGPPSPSLQRPKVLGLYDLPPPSPPPRGPLPDVPSDISRSTSPSWSIMDQSTSRFPRSAPADTADPRGVQQQQIRRSPPPSDRPNMTAHPLSREIVAESPRSPNPRIASPVPSALRGRVSPFPTAPVLPRETTTPLMRRTSKLTHDALIRAQQTGNPRAPVSASAYPSGHSKWPSQEHQLGVQWQPRSVSAMDTHRPSEHGNGHDSDDGQSSFLAYDDDDDLSDLSPNTRPTSTEPPEPSPDVNAILEGFRAEREADLNGLKANPMRESHTLSAIVAGYERDTMYLDAEEGAGERYSVWSDTASRHSLLDGERSAAIRAKFVRRVEAMYGKDTVPPVPQLDPGLKTASS
ncbi:hypothetical protein BD413DRAFT_194734 [Trametes elegans]|nr:hypothetical protein BD413DRAFT_194734 [Trametes elegans]